MWPCRLMSWPLPLLGTGSCVVGHRLLICQQALCCSDQLGDADMAVGVDLTLLCQPYDLAHPIILEQVSDELVASVVQCVDEERGRFIWKLLDELSNINGR